MNSVTTECCKRSIWCETLEQQELLTCGPKEVKHKGESLSAARDVVECPETVLCCRELKLHSSNSFFTLYRDHVMLKDTRAVTQVPLPRSSDTHMISHLQTFCLIHLSAKLEALKLPQGCKPARCVVTFSAWPYLVWNSPTTVQGCYRDKDAHSDTNRAQTKSEP